MHHGGSGAAGGGWVLIIIARYNKPGKTVNPKWFVVHHSSWPKCGTAWAQMIYWETPYPTKHNKRNYRHPRDLHPLYAKASPVGHWGQTHFEITVESTIFKKAVLEFVCYVLSSVHSQPWVDVAVDITAGQVFWSLHKGANSWNPFWNPAGCEIRQSTVFESNSVTFSSYLHKS